MVDAWLTFSANVSIRQPASKNMSASMVVRYPGTPVDFSASMLPRHPSSKAYSANARISKGTVSKAMSMNAVIRRVALDNFSCSIIVRNLNLKDQGMTQEAYVLKYETISVT